MNQQQRKYALERVDQITRKKIDDLRVKFRVEGRVITDERRAELVRTGKVKLRSEDTPISSYTRVMDAFDFSKYEWSAGPDPVRFNPAKAEVEASSQKVRDRIMLGDTEEALLLLEEFAA
ncbi:hypothetical protein [Roseixanthobacter pseudopolyaromaticivorans]|uniref:hypothetical protein n=1 Tax=Xanthobacteraceae TaxID=335928 RepID=UPI003727031A